MSEYKTFEETLEDLRKELVEPVKGFNVEGSYKYHGGNPFRAIIEIDANGKLVMNIWSDPNSGPKHALAYGKVVCKNDILEMTFIKQYPNLLNVPVFYRFKKTDGSKDYAGEYEGAWSFDEEALDPTKMRQATAQIVKKGKYSKSVVEKETANKSEMTIDTQFR